MNKPIKPTESELEILAILWERGASTVREIHEILEQQKEAGYTTTLKLMQIMHEKGLVTRDASAKTHIYEAAVDRELTQRQLLNKMIDTVFKGSASQLVMQALGHHRSSPEELDMIRQYLNEMEKKQK
ncbi:BlaI/MecI/CopY family transcriptional regulator [Chitinophaga barathri]|jgi:predicted transcriptional regulator|uniref:BlaI/MecI/CopY family transcriptional regulator n=1 Tax=Chitinophaga barathri TaxID=1647451 RepID=A0A3N4MNK6_9BACT|nr:BlaI/MecI/CopY family transcriptional regulator [Chitinophaga barathri]RPD41640.1 BlaI/MecI/CopY family transcriptional regulator [Chitinophaga barathri]